MPPPAAILLAFANDWVDDRRHLRSLLEESKAIGEVLAPLIEDGVLRMPAAIHNATVDDVLEAFRDRRYRDRIRIFHFGGHASGSKLLFEDEAGARSAAHAGGLAGYLGRQRGLVLVFLNGCCTEAQVRQLRAAGVKAVVATTSVIRDEVAAEFATAFYAELVTRPLRDAFETAEQAVRLRRGDDPGSVTRDVDEDEAPETPRWPWILDCDPAHEAWTLASERAPGRSWRRRLLVAAAALSLLLTASLLVSAGARRAACGVPGLRWLCAAAGIGDVPTAAEQALWDDALEQDSDEGLRAYLREYPTGVHAEEAHSRLAGCRTERVQTLGPERDIEYLLPVNPDRTHPLRTEEEARRDALERGAEDAKAACKPLQSKALLLRSARATPRRWSCTEQDAGFACGFDALIVCRVQDRIELDRKRCRDEDASKAAE